MNQLKQNLFLTRRDFEEALEEMILPLKQGLFNSEKPGVRLGSSGAVYDEKRAEKWRHLFVHYGDWHLIG